MEDFYYAGGLPALINAFAPQLDLSCLTITGKTLAIISRAQKSTTLM